MIVVMEKKDIIEKKDASKKYAFRAMKDIAININKPKDCYVDKKGNDIVGKKNTNYTKW